MLAYKADLERIDPNVEWLMTLYLHPEVTPDEIRKAAKAGVKGKWHRVWLHDLLLTTTQASSRIPAV